MTRKISQRRGIGYLVTAVLAPVAGAWLYGRQVDFDGDILAVELQGSGQVWPPAAGLGAALGWDLVLILGYGTSLVLLTSLARRLFWTSAARKAALAGAACAVAAIMADLVENAFLLAALQSDTGDWRLTAAAGAAAVKFSALAVAVPVALVALCTTAFRMTAHRDGATAPAVPTYPPPAGQTPPPAQREPHEATSSRRGRRRAATTLAAEVPHERWRAGYRVPGVAEDLDLDQGRAGEDRIGFCVSGGGIRSASVAMGALQGLRPTLLRARYLASVSGGGYTAGALQLALQPDPQSQEPGVAVPADVLMAGTPEEDHVRRHSSYIADGVGQWLVALGVVLRGLLASLLLVTAAVVALGVVLGLFYETVPIAQDVAELAPKDDGIATPFPSPGPAMQAAIVGVALAAGAAYVASLVVLSRSGSWWARGRQVARGLMGLLAVLAVLGVVVPVVVWASGAVLTLGDGDVAPTLAAGGGGTLLLSYVAALAAMAWRRRKAVGKALGRFKKSGTNGSQAVPTGVMQRLVVSGVLALLAGVLLLVLGSVVSTTAAMPRPDGWYWPASWEQPMWLLAGAVAVLTLLGGRVDQTRLGLHPFYRRRLASAFAVRRTPTGTAQPYDYQAEATPLASYAARRQSGQREEPTGVPAFPEVVFCCAANLSGQGKTPPGRRAVSFTMTSQWLGGPDVGYVATRDMHDAVSPDLQLDMTVQAAVAVSGAAFASAMGRHARSFQSLLALTNARLGTWLPNPAFVRARQDDQEWTTPGLPSLRRVTYLLREVFGLYPDDERLLYVTDGGHYENLALVELLRRRCTEIYCIDASGDGPPLAGTLGEAMSLAYEELGVRITLPDIRDLVAGGADPLTPDEPLTDLNGRLAKRAVVRGTVEYPAESGLPAEDRLGTIYFAKAVLTPQLPYEVLAYAARHPVFPHDSTGDQWFDTGQFNNYLELGRQLAERVKNYDTDLAAAAAQASQTAPA